VCTYPQTVQTHCSSDCLLIISTPKTKTNSQLIVVRLYESIKSLRILPEAHCSLYVSHLKTLNLVIEKQHFLVRNEDILLEVYHRNVRILKRHKPIFFLGIFFNYIVSQKNSKKEKERPFVWKKICGYFMLFHNRRNRRRLWRSGSVAGIYSDIILRNELYSCCGH